MRPSVRSFGLICAVALLLTVAYDATAQTIAVGNSLGVQGGATTVPVTLIAAADYTAVLARFEYDATALTSPSATAGPLLAAGHALDFHSPEPGRVNVAVYADSGMPAFTAQTGTLFTLSFDILPTARLGQSAIRFTTAGTPALPASDLTDTAGGVAPHQKRPGSVTIYGAAGVRPWMLYE
jgi:hypothetical protein